MEHPRHHIFDFTPATLADWRMEREMPGFRAKQVYLKGVADRGAMSDLSKGA